MPDSPLTVEGLLEDDSFVRWVLLDRAADRNQWLEYLSRFPEQSSPIGQARRELSLLAASLEDLIREQDWESLRKQIGDKALPREPDRSRLRRLYLRIAVAAAIAIVLTGAGLVWWIGRSATKPTQFTKTPVPDIAPGGNKAILTLANGQRIILDSAHTGQLAREAGTIISKSDSGLLTYNPAVSPANKNMRELVYNSISTPRGGQYRVVLPDGSKVWLNAASSIRFPAAFGSKERRVELSGEGYFEIAPQASRPFLVTTIGPHPETIVVLGTHFDVSAYAEDPQTVTTLIEGGIRVDRAGETVVLNPGQQALVDHSANAWIEIIKDADTDQAIAWTTGFFQFEHLDLPATLRQISRWYDVDIDDQTGPGTTARRFGGRIGRNLPLSRIIEILQSMNIHAQLQHKTLIILP